MKYCSYFLAASLLLVIGRNAAQEPSKEHSVVEISDSDCVALQDSEDELTRALKERFNISVRQTILNTARYKGGKSPLEAVYAAADLMLEAESELPPDHARQVALRQKWLTTAESLEYTIKDRHANGVDDLRVVYLAAFNVAHARVQLLHAKKQIKDK